MAKLRVIRSLVVSVAMLCSAATAQIQVLPGLDVAASGTISGGYSGAYGDAVQSSHGLSYGGTGAITGSFYNPNFLSFHINPYVNQSRSNSDSQSITDASGVDAGASIFSGSPFPGYVSYTKTINSTGNYHLPGLPDYITHGTGQAFSVAWSEVLRGVPSVTVGYTKGSSDYSLFGSQQNGNSAYNNFYLNSQYRVSGFNLNAGAGFLSNASKVPQLFSGQQSSTSTAHDKNFYASASHLLPLKGSVAATYSRNDLNSSYLGYSFNGTIDTVSSTVGFYPKQNWNVSINTSFNDNLNGQLYQASVPGAVASASGATQVGGPGQMVGVIAPVVVSSQSSRAWDLNGTTTYAFPRNWTVTGQVLHRQQIYRGSDYASNSFGGGGQYTRPLGGGFFNSNVFVTDTRLSYAGENVVGLNVNGNYARQIGNWTWSVAGGYSQSVQTLLITYTSSSYNFTGNVGRRFGRFIWSGGASFGHSGITNQPHTGYASQSYSMGVGYRGFSLQSNYAKSSGDGLAAGNTPLPPVIPPELLIAYGGTSYSTTLSGALRRGLTFSTTYLKADSSTTTHLVFSSNKLEEELVQVRYQVRKLGISGGYSRLVQGFSASSIAPTTNSTFSISIYRWFNCF